MMSKTIAHVKLDEEHKAKILKLAVEGNVSQWIRLLIIRELEALENGKNNKQG